ncbi:MAG: energy transducer TonB [Halioglobus sp.]
MNGLLIILLVSTLVACANTGEATRKTPLPGLSAYGLDQSVNLRASQAQAKEARSRGIDLPVGNYLPTKKVAPGYPPRALDRRKTGWVLVVYNITESGDMENLRIIDEYPEGVFSNSALEAAAQFEYAPYEENGVAVPVPNVWNLFTYEVY